MANLCSSHQQQYPTLVEKRNRSRVSSRRLEAPPVLVRKQQKRGKDLIFKISIQKEVEECCFFHRNVPQWILCRFRDHLFFYNFWCRSGYMSQYVCKWAAWRGSALSFLFSLLSGSCNFVAISIISCTLYANFQAFAWGAPPPHWGRIFIRKWNVP